MNILKTLLSILAICLLCSNKVIAQKASDSDAHVAILVYHHVASNTPASTSISVEKFAEHLAYLHENYSVLSLPDVIQALQNGDSLPDKTVVITFDDGYKNIYQNAHPLLRKYDMPYTIFVSPQLIGTSAVQLTWAEIATMSSEGVIFANHTSEHGHLLARLEGENQQQWLSRALADVEAAEALLTEKVGYSLKYLAYPYGEFDFVLRDALLARGYIGFGQQSGAISSYSDFGGLPRFPAAGVYANLRTLKTKMASLAMPITEGYSDPLKAIGDAPKVTLTLDTAKVKPGQVTCFYKNQPLEKVLTDDSFSFTIPEALPLGRSRVNCTAPSGITGRFYWFSQPFVVPTKEGVFLE
jgi:peptidoglycan/xylan/chitin deacetylase (PgdA/CDA1 family)